MKLSIKHRRCPSLNYRHGCETKITLCGVKNSTPSVHYLQLFIEQSSSFKLSEFMTYPTTASTVHEDVTNSFKPFCRGHTWSFDHR